eukprot:UN24478
MVTILLLTPTCSSSETSKHLGHFVTPPKTFPEAFEKSSSIKLELLSKYSNPILSFIFSIFQLFSLFLTYNLVGVS